jgi:hypothetical protein
MLLLRASSTLFARDGPPSRTKREGINRDRRQSLDRTRSAIFRTPGASKIARTHPMPASRAHDETTNQGDRVVDPSCSPWTTGQPPFIPQPPLTEKTRSKTAAQTMLARMGRLVG